MSVENFDGDGLADQPSVIYGYTDADDELHIKELSRSGYGEPGPSPGDVIDRDSTKSSLDTRLPELPIPGQDGLQREDCGEDISAFACSECGSPVYVGRTCANPHCSRDWAAAVKSKVVRTAGKLWAKQHVLYENTGKDIDFNHVVASMPDFLVDSDQPIERALTILQALLKYHWGIDDFVVIYHPYRIKQEYRKDQYEHGGEPGEGDMTWKDVLSSDDPQKYLYHSPHFHLFFPARRRQFDYSVVEAVQDMSGWSFHRITKGGEDSDSNTSVEDFDDLVHQLTYCFSHAGVIEKADRDELCSRLKGEIHNLYIPDDVEAKAVASFCSAAPKLLGVTFANLENATCDAEVPDSEGDQDGGDEESSTTSPSDTSQDDSMPADHPLYDIFDIGVDVEDSSLPAAAQSAERDPWPSGTLDASVGDGNSGTTDWSGGASESASASAQAAADSVDGTSEDDAQSPVVDERRACGGDLVPMHEAQMLLEDKEWCQNAPHVSGLRVAVAEWKRRTDGDEDLPWTDDEIDPDPSSVISDD